MVVCRQSFGCRGYCCSSRAAEEFGRDKRSIATECEVNNGALQRGSAGAGVRRSGPRLPSLAAADVLPLIALFGRPLCYVGRVGKTKAEAGPRIQFVFVCFRSLFQDFYLLSFHCVGLLVSSGLSVTRVIVNVVPYFPLVVICL